MTEIQKIEEIFDQCKIFRDAIESSLEELDEFFNDFPRGCCGDTAELLAAHLKDAGLGTFSYISGWDTEAQTSHAWLEKDGHIIDITPDQFEDAYERPFVTADDTWYQRFSNRQNIDDGDFRLQNSVVPTRLEIAYRIIQQNLNDK